MSPIPFGPAAATLALILLSTGCGAAEQAAQSGAPPTSSAPAEADEHAHAASGELGTVAFPVTCAPAAQTEFNRAVAQLHSFWFAPAMAGFKKVVELDATCAAGHWGTATSLLGNPFAWPLTGPALADGQAAVDRARALGSPTPRERSYVEAVGAFYRDAGTVEHRIRALAYTAAMRQLVADYPEDSEAKIFYALALAATAAPTDKTYANQQQAAQILEAAAVAQPDHPGVAHYLIHTYDYPSGAARGQAAAERYAGIAPAAPHAHHMPSHIFTRRGDWDASIRSNVASARLAKEELGTGHQQGAGSYNALHAMDYLVYAYLQLGRDADAQAVLDEIAAIEQLDVVNFAAAYAFAAIPARQAFERGDWKRAAGLALHPAGLEWTKFPQAEAVNAFARGLGAARSGDAAAAEIARERLGVLRDAMLAAKQDYWAEQAEIQRTTVAAWSALVEGRTDEAMRLMREATAREASTEKHPVMPGPLLPARELLAEMLLELNRPAEALAEFEASQLVEPNRFRGLSGTARAAAAAGDDVKARRFYEQFVELAKTGDNRLPEVVAARTYLSRTR